MSVPPVAPQISLGGLLMMLVTTGVYFFRTGRYG